MDIHTKKQIRSVLTGDEESLELPRLALDKYVTFIGEELEVREDFETNGWQCDFWVWWIRGETKFNLTGDLWYADKFVLYKEEAES